MMKEFQMAKGNGKWRKTGGSRCWLPYKGKAAMKKPTVLALAVVMQLALPHTTRAQGWMPAMDKLYQDESHCLTSPEIRSDKDNSISCYCRGPIRVLHVRAFT